MSDFKLFQKYFKEYQQRFGLMGYEIYFKHEPLEGVCASITDGRSMSATVRLNSNPSDEERKGLHRTAKHEAIHLLLLRLCDNARYRYSTSEEIQEATEELVNKLVTLIKT